MCNREYAKKIEKSLLDNGHDGMRQGEYMTTLDALTGDQVTCRLGHFKGESAAAMDVGADGNLICLTRDFIELVLERSVRHSQLRVDGPDENLPNLSVSMDPSSGVIIEAVLTTIEGEELIELFLDNRVEPVILEPGFLVELMLGLYK